MTDSRMSYIGVRGWTHYSQTKDIALTFNGLEHEPTRKLAIIVNVDDDAFVEGERRAHTRCGEGNAHARLRPPVDDIMGYEGHPGIFVDHPLVLNFVSLDTHEMLLWNRMDEFVDRCGPLFHGVEFGRMWPPEWVGEFRERYPSLRMILRITRDAVRAVSSVDDDARPFLVAERVAQYRGITDVLVNLSGPLEEGGVLFDAELNGRYLRAIRSAAPEVGLATAGGFGAKPASLKPLWPLLPEFLDLSINAGAALVSVANCVDASCAIGLYQRAERWFAENEEAVAAEAQFRASVERYKNSRFLLS